MAGGVDDTAERLARARLMLGTNVDVGGDFAWLRTTRDSLLILFVDTLTRAEAARREAAQLWDAVLELDQQLHRAQSSPTRPQRPIPASRNTGSEDSTGG
jgi:hypothetical protein